MKATVDKESCIGCGLCPSVCEEVFEMDDDGKAKAKVDTVPTNSENEAREAQDSCPVSAILIS